MIEKRTTPEATVFAAGGQTKTRHSSKKTKDKVPTRQQRWRKKYPKRYVAHLAVQNALRLGVMQKQPCAVCGSVKAEAHHPDYDRPFDVLWLCRKHHIGLHALAPKKGAANGA